jgi:hypothetical protein
MDSNIKFDPATDPAIQEFLDLFVPDPCVRMELEQLFSDAMRNSDRVNPDDVAKLKVFATLHNDPKYHSIRSLIRYAANTAVLQFLQAYRESQGRKS